MTGRACLLCGGPAAGEAFPFETLWNGRNYRYFECRRCACTFIDPVPTDEELAALFDPAAYHATYYAGHAPTPAEEEALDEAAARLRPGAAILDFGCGNGSFLVAARRRGYRCDGIERDPMWCRRLGEATGAEVTTLEAAERSGRRFDVIRLADVIGHLGAPAAVLERLRGMLEPGGLFLIEGPLEKQVNVVRLAAVGAKRLARLAGRRSGARHAPYHLSFTDWHSQLHFFEQVAGLSCLEVRLTDTGWPYSESRGAGFGARVRRTIAKASVAFSSTGLGRRLGSANRFRAILAAERPASG